MSSASSQGLGIKLSGTLGDDAIANASILILGIATAIILQVLFSQWSVMNTLFATAPVTWNQWLICLLPMLPMLPTALFVNWIDPPQANVTSNVSTHQ